MCDPESIAPGSLLQLSQPNLMVLLFPWLAISNIPTSPPAPSLCDLLIYPTSFPSFQSLLVSDLS